MLVCVDLDDTVFEEKSLCTVRKPDMACFPEACDMADFAVMEEWEQRWTRKADRELAKAEAVFPVLVGRRVAKCANAVEAITWWVSFRAGSQRLEQP